MINHLKCLKQEKKKDSEKVTKNTSNKFERGRLDDFKIEADDLGKIEKIL